MKSEYGWLSDGNVNVAGTLLDAGVQQFVNEDRGHVGVSCRRPSIVGALDKAPRRWINRLE
jgi:hypothetical protein